MKDRILILNYSDAFALETAQRLRLERIWCSVMNGATTAAQIREIAPSGIILSGEAVSGGGVLDAEILKLGIPILAMGHAAHLMLAALGGACAAAAITDRKALVQYEDMPLFAGMESGERYIGEALTLMLPPDIMQIAAGGGCTLAYADEQRHCYGVQFQLERNDPEGSALLRNFAEKICRCEPEWTMQAYMENAMRELTEEAASGRWALCAVSGGVDSTTAAVMAHRAFGDRMRAVLIDTGLLRQGEFEQCRETLCGLNVPLICADRSGDILNALRGKKSMDEKRSVVLEQIAGEMERQAEAIDGERMTILGYHYSDMLQSSVREQADNENGAKTCEPLKGLFKDEVRELAELIGLPENICMRKPFPALGLGARIVGEVTGERLHAVRTADAIFSEEIREAGLEKKLYKYFPILMAADSANEEQMIVLRAVTISGGVLNPARLPYDLIERTVKRIQETAPQVVRVLYDQTPTQLGKETFS